MLNTVGQIADRVHPGDICPGQRWECAAVAVDQEGDVGEVDQAVGRRASLKRLQASGMAALVARARLLVEHQQADPVRPVLVFKDRRDVLPHRVAVDGQRAVGPILVRGATVSHWRLLSVGCAPPALMRSASLGRIAENHGRSPLRHSRLAWSLPWLQRGIHAATGGCTAERDALRTEVGGGSGGLCCERSWAWIPARGRE